MTFDAPLSDYTIEAARVLTAVQSGNDEAAWRFKWNLPRFRGRHMREVRAATLDEADAQLLVAQEHAFDSWSDLSDYVDTLASDGPVAVFERAVETVVDGRTADLVTALRADPTLASARSTRRHHCTLLHYLGANGVEASRQRTPATALDVATALLDAGADPNALADLYDQRCTTMSMLVSSSHPANTGLQLPLALRLADRGAALRGVGSTWQSAVLTALTFGHLDTARGLAAREGTIDDVVELAGLGRLDDLRARVPHASAEARQAALSLAAQLGHANVVALLLAHGADPNRYNPEGFHAHATPLHQAALHGHLAVVERLIEGGARGDLADALYDATPLGWAEYGQRAEVATYLRSRA